MRRGLPFPYDSSKISIELEREREEEEGEEEEEGDRKSIRMGVRSVVVAVLLCTTHVSAESELLTD